MNRDRMLRLAKGSHSQSFVSLTATELDLREFMNRNCATDFKQNKLSFLSSRLLGMQTKTVHIRRWRICLRSNRTPGEVLKLQKNCNFLSFDIKSFEFNFKDSLWHEAKRAEHHHRDCQLLFSIKILLRLRWLAMIDVDDTSPRKSLSDGVQFASSLLLVPYQLIASCVYFLQPQMTRKCDCTVVTTIDGLCSCSFLLRCHSLASDHLLRHPERVFWLEVRNAPRNFPCEDQTWGKCEMRFQLIPQNDKYLFDLKFPLVISCSFFRFKTLRKHKIYVQVGELWVYGSASCFVTNA